MLSPSTLLWPTLVTLMRRVSPTLCGGMAYYFIKKSSMQCQNKLKTGEEYLSPTNRLRSLAPQTSIRKHLMHDNFDAAPGMDSSKP